jgi:hypothetical protein
MNFLHKTFLQKCSGNKEAGLEVTARQDLFSSASCDGAHVGQDFSGLKQYLACSEHMHTREQLLFKGAVNSSSLLYSFSIQRHSTRYLARHEIKLHTHVPDALEGWDSPCSGSLPLLPLYGSFNSFPLSFPFLTFWPLGCGFLEKQLDLQKQGDSHNRWRHVIDWKDSNTNPDSTCEERIEEWGRMVSLEGSIEQILRKWQVQGGWLPVLKWARIQWPSHSWHHSLRKKTSHCYVEGEQLWAVSLYSSQPLIGHNSQVFPPCPCITAACWLNSGTVCPLWIIPCRIYIL